MLNIPRDKEYRKGFVADDDHVVETDDYAGCELRIWADQSEDPKLCDAFNRGMDVHCYAASKMFNREVTKTNEHAKLRTPAKNSNFGIIYGMGPHALMWRIRGEGYPIYDSLL